MAIKNLQFENYLFIFYLNSNMQNLFLLKEITMHISQLKCRDFVLSSVTSVAVLTSAGWEGWIVWSDKNYRETSGIPAAAAVYQRSEMITKEPLWRGNSIYSAKFKSCSVKVGIYWPLRWAIRERKVLHHCLHMVPKFLLIFMWGKDISSQSLTRQD